MPKTEVAGFRSSLLFYSAIYSFLTHTPTHEAKNTDGDNGEKSAKEQGVPQRKAPERAKKPGISSHTAVGKDEVPSSNLGSSSKKA